MECTGAYAVFDGIESSVTQTFGLDIFEELSPAALDIIEHFFLTAQHPYRNVVDLMHRLAGTSAIYQRSRLERHFRDALTLRHHGFVSEIKYETVGQLYLGVPP